MYSIQIDGSINLSNLNQRNIRSDLKNKIVRKIEEKKSQNRLRIYDVSIEEFKHWNPRV